MRQNPTERNPMSDLSDALAPTRSGLLRWMARTGPVTAEALARRHGLSVAGARGRLLAAQRDGLLSRSRPLREQPSLYTLTCAGLRAAGMPGEQPGRISAANAHHSIVCCEVAVSLELAYPAREVIGERELRRCERERSAVIASANCRGDGLAGRVLHRPDLVLTGPRGALPVAVEVELSVKAPRRLLSICRAWARCRCVAGVLYVSPAEVQEPLRRAIAGASAGDRIALLSPSALGLDPAVTAPQRNIPGGP
jgi:hypothetical protein